MATSAQAQTEPAPLAATLAEPTVTFPADLSHLNHRPAGALGRVRVRGEALEFGDGSPARFWGVNIQANALYGTQDADIALHATRLARMGVNLVRLHHHDSAWVKTNIFGRDAQSTGALDAAALGRLDAWIAALRAQGIYIWLDLHVGRLLAPQDEITHGDELRASRHKGDLRGYNFVNDDITALMVRFARQYLGHVNPHTGLSYAQDPAIAVVQISNENDLIKHFANRLLPGKGAPGHAAWFAKAAEAFTAQHGMRADRVLRGQPGKESALFLSDLEHRFFARMTREIREIGYEGLIATSSFWGGMPLSGLSSLSAGDLIDVHSYARPGDMRSPPTERGSMLTRIAGAQVAGQPLSVSEWNMGGFPAEDRYMTPPRIAAMAAFQGWDALMLYGYAQRALSIAPRPGGWHANNDPAIIAGLPVGALLYRAGHVRPARDTHYFTPDPDDLYGLTLSANTVPALRDIPHRTGLRVVLPKVAELPWMASPHPSSLSDARVFSDPGARPLEQVSPDGPVVSDTGEMWHDAQAGRAGIDTPRSKLVMGRLAGPMPSGLQVEMVSTEALVAVQSLDIAPLSEARAVLVSLVTDTRPEREHKLPFVSAPLSGTVRFNAPAGLVLRDVVPASARAQITHSVSGTTHMLSVAQAPGALWLTFGPPAPAPLLSKTEF